MGQREAVRGTHSDENIGRQPSTYIDRQRESDEQALSSLSTNSTHSLTNDISNQMVLKTPDFKIKRRGG